MPVAIMKDLCPAWKFASHIYASSFDTTACLARKNRAYLTTVVYYVVHYEDSSLDSVPLRCDNSKRNELGE